MGAFASSTPRSWKSKSLSLKGDGVHPTARYILFTWVSLSLLDNNLLMVEDSRRRPSYLTLDLTNSRALEHIY